MGVVIHNSSDPRVCDASGFFAGTDIALTLIEKHKIYLKDQVFKLRNLM